MWHQRRPKEVGPERDRNVRLVGPSGRFEVGLAGCVGLLEAVLGDAVVVALGDQPVHDRERRHEGCVGGLEQFERLVVEVEPVFDRVDAVFERGFHAGGTLCVARDR